MSDLIKTAGRLVVLVSILALTACTAAPAATGPTPDLDAVRTQAAQTVVANMTVQAALNPPATATALPATAIPEPTATQVPTLVPTLPAVVIPTATVRVVSSGGGSLPAQPTKASYTDQAKMVSQTPIDYTTVKAGGDFDIRWTIRNTGKRDWNTQFYFRYVKGTLKNINAKVLMMPDAIGRNDTVEFVIDAVAPKEPGAYTTYWEIVNDDGVAFFHFFSVVTVE